MPIYEFYSPDTNRIYSFYAKTLVQGKLIPKCPDNPKAQMVKLLSSFAVGGAKKAETPASLAGDQAGGSPEDSRMEAAFGAMEQEFSGVDENDPRAMARMMRRMADLTGEKIQGPMEEAMRKLEEGVDPETLEAQMEDAFGPATEEGLLGPGSASSGGDVPAESRAKLKIRRAPVRDPKLYDYE
jgi:hypothetical protein